MIYDWYMIWYDMIWYDIIDIIDTIWYDIWYMIDMIWYDWYNTVRYDMIILYLIDIMFNLLMWRLASNIYIDDTNKIATTTNNPFWVLKKPAAKFDMLK